MKKTSFFRRIFPLLVVLCTFLVSVPVSAQGEVMYYDPITEIDLGVDELTLEVGETYVFQLTHVPAETPNAFLTWYADDVVVTVDPEALSVTALAAGTTRILVESNAGFAFDFCDITVVGEGPVDEPEGKAGNQMLTLSDEARNKIEAKTVLNFLDFMENANLSDEMMETFGSRMFNITAKVAPGSVSEERQRALDLGFKRADGLQYLNGVRLYGSLFQILEFVENNPDLISIFEFAPIKITDPVVEMEDDLSAKELNLNSNVDAITNVSAAHNKGFTGKGMAVAIIDTGLNKDHEQFAGRVVVDECLLTEDPIGFYTPVCVTGSSAPSLSANPAAHNHGSHVAGIAAGRDGIAPDALIISISIAAETCSDDGCVDTIVPDIWVIADYLAQLQDESKENGWEPIVSANMSFGGILGPDEGFSNICDDLNPDWKYTEAMELLSDKDIIPVVASGNEGLDGQIADPACRSKAFRIGALNPKTTPEIVYFSNYSTMIDILAPGTDIYSALYAWDPKLSKSTCDDADDASGRLNCYGEMSGTSMATPMVTGAFALLKQANPDMSAAQLEELIKSMSTKSADYRDEGWVNRGSEDFPDWVFIPEKTFAYKKPVLTFDNLGDNGNQHPVMELFPFPSSSFDFGIKLPSTGITASVLPEKPVDLNYKNLNWNVQIPTISVSADIVEVPFRDDEYAVTWLGDKAGLLAGFPMPGRGTTVIAGHNHLNAEEAGPFAMLQFVKEGDRIFIQSPDNSNTTYIVYANEKIEETDFAAFERIAGARKNAVVFITCEDERVDGGYANRRIVAAMPE